MSKYNYKNEKFVCSTNSIGRKFQGPCAEKVKVLQNKYVAPCHKPIYQQPLLIHKGYMQYLYDANGKEYLDCFGESEFIC